MPGFNSPSRQLLAVGPQCYRDRSFPLSLFTQLIAVLALSLFATLCTAADLEEMSDQWRSGKYAQLVDAAATGIEENPFNEGYWLYEIRAQMELGRYADALKTLDAGLEQLPQSIRLRWLGRDVCRYNNQAPRSEELEKEIIALVGQRPWRYGDVDNRLVIGRLMLAEDIDPKKVLDNVYNEIKQRQPNFVDVFLANGELALAKHDYQLAADAYQQAAKWDSKNPDVQLGVARSFAPSDSEKANTALQLAIEQNPHHIESLLVVAENHIDAERYDEAEKALAKVIAVNASHPQALAFRAVIAILRNQPEDAKRLHAAALRHWPGNPEVDHSIGRKLSQKYRFAEGEQRQREALKLDADYLPAKAQLAQDLLRLGREEEGLKLAEEVYDADAYNVFAHNLVTLQESLDKFRTLEKDGFIVRMDAREADIYGQRVLELLVRAKRTLCAKYSVELKQPIIVEIFPKQQDFAIRTFGLPGGAGFLGVCFGTVITANSPAALGANSASWEATLWHEFCHVVTLNKTHNKMPRWLSEGISVYEERQADPTWGQSMNPRFREMILGPELTPVSQLSGAFLGPKSPLHLQFAYFESSLVVEHVLEKYGLESLKRILDDLGAGMPINETLARHTGSIESLDAEFAAYARKRAEGMAPDADWSVPELPPKSGADEIARWLKDHPKNYTSLKRLADLQIASKQWQDAKRTLQSMVTLYPKDASAGGPYKLLAKVYRELNDRVQERASLEKLAELSSDDVDTLSRLTELALEAKDFEAVRKYALRWLSINPMIAEPYRRLGIAAERLGDSELAVHSYRALLLLDPFDSADAHYRLALALRDSGGLDEAKKHALLALEETPRFQAAQRLLLEIVDSPKPPPPPKSTADDSAPKDAATEDAKAPAPEKKP